MKEIGIMGLSANPITNGHIQLAQFVLDNTNMDEVWITPCYNHMYDKDMVDAKHRLEMCKIAARTDKRIKVFDYEIKHQLRGETYNLFKKLKQDKEFKKYNFNMIIGIDNADTFDKWVNYKELEKMVKFIVVPRKGYVKNENVNWYLNKPHIFLDNSDIIECSSTFIREKLYEYTYSIEQVRLLIHYIDIEVLEYIMENNLYENL